MTIPRTALILYFFVVWILWPAGAWGESLQLPLTVELPLLRSLIARQAYPLPGEKASLYHPAQGCNQIVLSSPQLTEERGYLRFQTEVQLKWGTPVMESCLTPLTWKGSIILWQRPRINTQWQLSFETVDSAVLDTNNRPIKAVDLLWDLIKDHIHQYLNKIIVNLAPPVTDLKSCLLPMFDHHHQNMAHRFFASMRPDAPILRPEGLRINILAEIDLPRQNDRNESAPHPTQQHYSRVIELWHTWDNFLILQLKQFSHDPLSTTDRSILLDTMLTVRYEFTDAIKEDRLSNHFIRDQFLWGWKQLSPVFRNHLSDDSKTNPLGYLAFFTANDALQILDRLGPAVGIEMSADGFRRLAALISSEPLEQPGNETDQKLRKVLGLDPLQDAPLPVEFPLPVPTTEDGDPSSWLHPVLWRNFALLFSPPQALANETGQKFQTEIKQWTAELIPASVLLPKVHNVLQTAATREQNKRPFLTDAAGWFEKMIVASAWQESCFRQFHINNKTITYLLSSNKTAVGIMQVNEQIWRGVYSTRQLRWNIEYNSQAGCEIMGLYLRDYLLKEKIPTDVATPQGQRFLATWLYALYNGGPGQRRPFLSRYTGKKLFRSEQLFLAKYDAVAEEAWIDRVHCLP